MDGTSTGTGWYKLLRTPFLARVPTGYYYVHHTHYKNCTCTEQYICTITVQSVLRYFIRGHIQQHTVRRSYESHQSTRTRFGDKASRKVTEKQPAHSSEAASSTRVKAFELYCILRVTYFHCKTNQIKTKAHQDET
jgi:hypothetical protein